MLLTYIYYNLNRTLWSKDSREVLKYLALKASLGLAGEVELFHNET